MQDLKEEKPRFKTDVVIPLNTGSRWDNNELRYTLRSFEKYFKNLGTIYIVGPKVYFTRKVFWLKNVIIVDCDDPFTYSKDANMVRKVLKVINDYPELSEDFVRCSDDQTLLKEVKELPPYYVQDMSKREESWWRNRPNRWKLRLRRTYKILLAHKYPTFNYESHIPMIVNKHKFKEVWAQYPYTRSIGYTINTIYYNRMIDDHVYIGKSLKASIKSQLDTEEKVKNKLKGKTYLGYNDRELTRELKAILADKFKKKSKFEK